MTHNDSLIYSELCCNRYFRIEARVLHQDLIEMRRTYNLIPYDNYRCYRVESGSNPIWYKNLLDSYPGRIKRKRISRYLLNIAHGQYKDTEIHNILCDLILERLEEGYFSDRWGLHVPPIPHQLLSEPITSGII